MSFSLEQEAEKSIKCMKIAEWWWCLGNRYERAQEMRNKRFFLLAFFFLGQSAFEVQVFVFNLTTAHKKISKAMHTVMDRSIYVSKYVTEKKVCRRTLCRFDYLSQSCSNHRRMNIAPTSTRLFGSACISRMLTYGCTSSWYPSHTWNPWCP